MNVDELAVASDDEYYRLKINLTALRLLRGERASTGTERATINSLIAETVRKIGRNRCSPSDDGNHSDECDGNCGKGLSQQVDAGSTPAPCCNCAAELRKIMSTVCHSNNMVDPFQPPPFRP